MNIFKRLVAIVLIAAMTCTPVFAETLKELQTANGRNSLVVSKVYHYHRYDDTGKCKICGKKLLWGKIFKSKKHKINSNYEAQYLAAICAEEGGTREGYRMNVSFIANKYTIATQNKNFKNKYPTIYDFVSKSHWYASNVKSIAAKKAKAKAMSRDQTDVIYLIIQRGLHTIHPFVDEYDCVEDITSPKKLNTLKRGDIVKNRYESTYHFYKRAKYTVNKKVVLGDVYGYTQEALKLYKAGKLKP